MTLDGLIAFVESEFACSQGARSSSTPADPVLYGFDSVAIPDAAIMMYPYRTLVWRIAIAKEDYIEGRADARRSQAEQLLLERARQGFQQIKRHAGSNARLLWRLQAKCEISSDHDFDSDVQWIKFRSRIAIPDFDWACVAGLFTPEGNVIPTLILPD